MHLILTEHPFSYNCINLAHVVCIFEEKTRFLLLTRKPGDLAVCLCYIILLLLERRIDLYEISIRLNPRVHELDGKT